MNEDRELLTPEKAEDFLPKTDRIHTFRQARNGMLIGADWDREEILKVIREFTPELSGEVATKMGHGIVIFDNTGPLFVQTAVEPPHPADFPPAGGANSKSVLALNR